MRVGITGSSGLVGSALQAALLSERHEIVCFQRGTGRLDSLPPGLRSSVWDPAQGTIDREGLAECDAVVHLAGENIAAGRWTEARKQKIRDSRVLGTDLVARAIASLDSRPQCLICASAIGYYGDTGDRTVDETAPAGTGFLAGVCQQWESAARPALEAGVRVVFLRFGLILSRKGGALAKMLFPFQCGLGGVVGPGTQYWSWIALPDAVRAIQHAIATSDLQGPVNVVAPRPVTNREFTQTLGKVLHRPTILPLPAFAARLVFGEMADHLMLSSARIVPAQLQRTGFRYQCAELAAGLAQHR